ncbi:hypothetical protein TNCV_3025261 [Trichonephila clavipes]|nr:hypothetical protein TNCV_3025261 [Trichonephila clavipes]
MGRELQRIGMHSWMPGRKLFISFRNAKNCLRGVGEEDTGRLRIAKRIMWSSDFQHHLWPPHRRDFSPIENVWNMVRDASDISLLFSGLNVYWTAHQKHVDSLFKRIRAVIRSKDGPNG